MFVPLSQRVSKDSFKNLKTEFNHPVFKPVCINLYIFNLRIWEEFNLIHTLYKNPREIYHLEMILN